MAELVAAFSLATDLGLGQPMEHVLRSWVIAARLGDHVGLEPDDRGALYYVATLAWVGCVADTPEVATWFGDDIAYRGDSYQIDMAGLPLLGFMLRHVGIGSPALHRLRLGASLVVTGGKGVERALLSHCLTTARMAERLGLGTDVCDALQQAFTRWDGKGVPGGVGGEAIALPMRLFQLADIVEVFHRGGGADAAIEVARARRGKAFDPDVVDAFCPVAADVLGDPSADLDWQSLVAGDPMLQRRLTEDEFDAALEAIADFTDLRSPSRAGHSRAVAELAAVPPASCRLCPQRTSPRFASGTGARHRHARHPRHDPRQGKSAIGVGGRTDANARLLHRADAGPTTGPRPAGRHRRVGPRTLRRLRLPPRSRRAGHPRHRTAARRRLRLSRHDRATRPSPAADRQAGGQRAARRRAGGSPRRRRRRRRARRRRSTGRQAPQRPGRAHPREIEVLTLIARGASTRQVARQLSITPKTAETHIERIYAKIGASTRSTATLFAMQHGLLDTLEPLDL